MKILCALSFIGIAGAASGGMVDFTYNFDGVPILTEANTLPGPSGLGVEFVNAVLSPDLDSFGDPIPGTTRWRPDITAPAVTVDDPSRYGRGAAPSPSNALEALFQPVLIIFDVPFNVDSFSTTLDNDTFGANGFLPGFADIAVQFFAWGTARVGNVPVDQTTAGFQVSAGSIANVGAILLPAGAFYDDLRLTGTVVPTPGPAALFSLGLLAMARRRR